MLELSTPSRELAARILVDVSFPERIFGIENNGESEVEEVIYGFEEAVCFLDGDVEGVLEQLRQRPGASPIANLIDLEVLRKWVGGTFGDKELALAIGEITKEADKPMMSHERYLKNIELTGPVRELMEQRLKQCKEVIGEETKT